MKHLWCLATLAVVLVQGEAQAADSRFPDWPCIQVRVPELSAAAVWSGPTVEDAEKPWRADPQITELVAQLAARRLPLEEAEQQAASFVDQAGNDRQEKASLLFTGLFDTLNQERRDVINGLERLTRRQREFVRTIEADAARLRELQSKPDADQREIQRLTDQVTWGTRIFEERRRTIRYVCEVPVIIEKRLFMLARSIQQALG